MHLPTNMFIPLHLLPGKGIAPEGIDETTAAGREPTASHIVPDANHCFPGLCQWSDSIRVEKPENSV